MVTSALVLSDTHSPRHWKRLPATLIAPLQLADLVLHAGDVCTPDVLDTLAEFAPVRVVRGNNDGDDIVAWGAPDTHELTLEGVRLAMIHDAGAATGRARRMRRRFPTADLVVFGHSHIPLQYTPVETSSEVALFNPGSPTDKRRQPQFSYGWLQFDDGAIVRRELHFWAS